MNIELSDAEVLVLQDAVAGEVARYLMHSERWDHNPLHVDRYETLIEVGRKVGLEL